MEFIQPKHENDLTQNDNAFTELSTLFFLF